VSIKHNTLRVVCLAAMALPMLAEAHLKAEGLQPPGVFQHQLIFPDTAKYKVLTADLHTHSVFSDGHVWPNIRVAEGLREGLDVIAITEHLEWQPHMEDLPHRDRNRAFEIARDAAEGEPITVIAGAEITRESPVGHINAVFINDANAMLKVVSHEADASIDTSNLPDWGVENEVLLNYLQTGRWPASEAVSIANQQGAFVFWNHPSYSEQSANGLPPVSEQHIEWFTSGAIQGIEVVNSSWYSPESFQLALDYDLTLIGTSDVHDLIDWDYRGNSTGHRPVTLILAESNSPEDIKAALFAKRTAVWHQQTLLGRQPELSALIEASLVIASASYKQGTSFMRVTIENRANIPFLLAPRSAQPRQHSHAAAIEVPALGSIEIEVVMDERQSPVEWQVDVMNALVAPNQPLRHRLLLSP